MGSSADRKSLEAARPVGHPGPPDLAVMSEDELEECRATVAKLRDLSDRAQDGDEKAVLEIRKILDGSPDLAWLFIKGPGKIAESALINEMTKDGDLATKEFLSHQLESMRIEVAGENPSALERLLAERVVATWLEVQLFEALYAVGMKSGTFKEDDHCQKRLDRAHRRHLSAIRTLAQIRKLGPAVQINIAEKQINTAGTTWELLGLERRTNAKMGMDLSGKGGYFRLSIHGWRAALELAHEQGWEPAGTKPPEFTAYAPDGVTLDEVATQAYRQRYADWDGSYFWNEYQVVCDEDAANIADTLERALDDVPDEGGGDNLLTPAQYQAYRRGELSQEDLDKAIEQFMERRAASPPQIPPQTPAWYFAGEKDYLREFITFCRAGEFAIG